MYENKSRIESMSILPSLTWFYLNGYRFDEYKFAQNEMQNDMA